MTLIPVFHTFCIYASDFNYNHTEWRYNGIKANRECLEEWATNNDLTLLQDSKDPTFHSGRWKSETNPELVRTETTCLLPDRQILGKFLLSQQRPSLVKSFHRITSTSNLVQRSNFRKAD